MAKRPVTERVNEYAKKHPEAYNLLLEDANEIRELDDMTAYKAALLKLLDLLSDKSIKRLYQLAQYLYVYKE